MIAAPKTEIQTIFFDMDGVLANFDKFVHSHGVFGWEAVDDFMIKEVPNGLFYKLDPMPDFALMKQLMADLHEKGYNVEILTAVGDPRKGKQVDPAVADKKLWLEKYGLSNYHMNWTFTGKQKAIYANPWCVLIDDMHKNIQHFVEAGGHGIVFEGYHPTTEKLNKLL